MLLIPGDLKQIETILRLVNTTIKEHGKIINTGKPEEVAGAVLYLASDDSAFITGRAISVDGGATMI